MSSCSFYFLPAALLVCTGIMWLLFNAICRTGFWQELGKFHCPEFSPALVADGKEEEGSESSTEENLPIGCIWNSPEHPSGSCPECCVDACVLEMYIQLSRFWNFIHPARPLPWFTVLVCKEYFAHSLSYFVRNIVV